MFNSWNSTKYAKAVKWPMNIKRITGACVWYLVFRSMENASSSIAEEQRKSCITVVIVPVCCHSSLYICSSRQSHPWRRKTPLYVTRHSFSIRSFQCVLLFLQMYLLFRKDCFTQVEFTVNKAQCVGVRQLGDRNLHIWLDQSDIPSSSCSLNI